MVPAVAAVYQIPEVQCFTPHALHRQIFNLQSVQQGPGYGVIGEAVAFPGSQADIRAVDPALLVGVAGIADVVVDVVKNRPGLLHGGHILLDNAVQHVRHQLIEFLLGEGKLRGVGLALLVRLGKAVVLLLVRLLRQRQIRNRVRFLGSGLLLNGGRRLSLRLLGRLLGLPPAAGRQPQQQRRGQQAGNSAPHLPGQLVMYRLFSFSRHKPSWAGGTRL